MALKDILNKFKFRNKTKVESDSSYCYTTVIWNTISNLIILVSFSKEYFEQIIELQDAIASWSKINSKIVFSSYDEEITKEDEDGNIINMVISHKKYYMLIGADPSDWVKIYERINNLSNDVLAKITNEIINNCNPCYFKSLIEDGVIPNFNTNKNRLYPYDTSFVKTKNGFEYINPTVLRNRLPRGFTGRDILKFTKVYRYLSEIDALSIINCEVRHKTNEEFRNKYDLYPLYDVLFPNPTVERLTMLLDPLYKQPDDDSVPGNVSDESLDEIFREQYERFSAVADDNIEYEDIDEVLGDNEETENMRDGDKIE